MTTKVHKKCRFYSMTSGTCTLTQGKQKPWDEACVSFALKDIYRIKEMS